MAQIDWMASWQYIVGQIHAFLSMNFWQEIAAVFIGVFTALWVNEWNERRKDKEKRMNVLNIIADEIAENSNNMAHWRGLSPKGKEKELLHAMLRDESWRAFSEGGEIECIKDGTLLYAIARTYYTIRAVRDYAEYYYKETSVVEDKLMDAIDYSEETITYAFDLIIEALGEQNELSENEDVPN